MNILAINKNIMAPPQTVANRLARVVYKPLILILLIQAAVSTIVLHNTIFLDEATYTYAGEQLLHGTATIEQYATYFSGYPGFYPLLAGALNQLGGLELVRLFSTACMLVTTACVFLVTERLFSRPSAYAAAALFAFTGPTLFLSRLATFDALALMLLATATVLAVSVASAQKQLATAMSLSIALLLVLAVAAKYAALLWVPFVIALLALWTIQQHGWRRSYRYPVITVAGITIILWVAMPLVTYFVLQGIGFTTTDRTAMIPKPPAVLLATILQAGSLIWLLGLIGLMLIPRRQRLVSLLLLIASIAAPAYHLHTGESTSLYKHMGFALFFAAPVAGAALAAIAQRIPMWWHTHHLTQPAIVLGCLILIVVAASSAWVHYTNWTNTSQLAATMSPLLSNRPVRCLCEDAEVIQYELSATTAAWQYTDPYYFHYHVGKLTLVGDTAYTAAIDAGYFGVIELSFDHPVAQIAVDAIHSGHARYHLVAVLPQNNAPHGGFVIWALTNTANPAVLGLHVDGNHLVDAAGQVVTLRGVNRDESDFLCVEGKGIFDGPTDEASIQALLSWHINVVRIPLNEECWLGINGLSPKFSGAAYRNAVIQYTNSLNADGIYVILDLHKNAPGNGTDAHSLQAMPDADHSSTFWQEVAEQFKGNDMVLFDLFNEPHTTWSCWLNGGICPGIPYTTVGMQSLVNTVRSTGANNVILLAGQDYANDLAYFLDHLPVDPLDNLSASWHVYPASDGCGTVACYNTEIAPVAAAMPLVVTEFGVSARSDSCDMTGVETLLPWLDAHQIGYLAFSWNISSPSCDGLGLISNYNGTPHAPNGTYYKAYLLQVTKELPTPAGPAYPAVVPLTLR